MAFKLAININWTGNRDLDRIFDTVRAADEAGVQSVLVAEAWGYDAVPLMTQIVERTQQMQVGSGILNIYSRTPGLLAQTFATLDILSRGRMFIGLGTSGANVIEHFHGVPFKQPLRRMKEYVDIINTLMSEEKLNYDGKIFQLHRGFTLRFPVYRKHLPIYIASLTPRSVKQTAEIADGWLPTRTPVSEIAGQVKQFRAAATAAGRDAAALQVRSPGAIHLVSGENVDRARQAAAGNLAFYVARMGVFYYEHLARLGYADEVAAIKAAFDKGGSAAGTAAVPSELQQACDFVTDSLDAARGRLAEQEEAGIDVHSVDVQAGTAAEARRLYERLLA